MDAEFWLCGLGLISRGIFAAVFWSYLDDLSAFDLLAAAAAVGILLVWINWFLLNKHLHFGHFKQLNNHSILIYWVGKESAPLEKELGTLQRLIDL